MAQPAQPSASRTQAVGTASQLRTAAFKLLLMGCRSSGAAFIKWGQWSATREDIFPAVSLLLLLWMLRKFEWVLLESASCWHAVHAVQSRLVAFVKWGQGSNTREDTFLTVGICIGPSMLQEHDPLICPCQRLLQAKFADESSCLRCRTSATVCYSRTARLQHTSATAFVCCQI